MGSFIETVKGCRGMYNFKEDNIMRKDELEMDIVSPKRRIGGSVNYAFLHLKTWILVPSYAIIIVY